MEERTLSNSESLQLITQMIKATKTKLEKGGGSIFLIWGYTTLLTSIAVYATLAITGNYFYTWLWFSIPVVGSIIMFTTKKRKSKEVVTYIDRIINYLWLVLGCSAVILPFVAMFLNFHFPLMAAIGYLIMFGVTMTGIIINFKALWICGITGICISMLIPFLSFMNQIVAFAVMFTICMIIPGHILKYNERRHN